MWCATIEYIHLDTANERVGVIVGNHKGCVFTRYRPYQELSVEAQQRIDQTVYAKLPIMRQNQFSTPFKTINNGESTTLNCNQFEFWVALKHEVDLAQSPLKFEQPEQLFWVEQVEPQTAVNDCYQRAFRDVG